MAVSSGAARTALWVLPVGDIGGVARHALDVATVGIPGWRVVVLAPPGPVIPALQERGAAVLEQPFGPDHGLAASVATLRHTVGRLRPDIVHTHLAFADLAAALSVTGPALVSTEHGIAGDDSVYHASGAQARLMALAHRARVRRAAALIAVSEATARAIRDKWGVRREIVVIPNGIDAPEAAPARTGLRVLSLARLAPEKRLDRLVDAMALVRRTHPDAHLTLAGAGPLESALRHQVRQAGLDDAVTFAGFVDPVPAMREAHVAALLSVWENCSYALLDAVSEGMGVVAAPVGGNPEILPERCLVDADHTDRVAAAIIEQGVDPDARPRLGDWPTVADMTGRIADCYARVSSP